MKLHVDSTDFCGTRYQTERTGTIRWKGQEALLPRKRSTSFNDKDALATAARRVHDTEIFTCLLDIMNIYALMSSSSGLGIRFYAETKEVQMGLL